MLNKFFSLFRVFMMKIKISVFKVSHPHSLVVGKKLRFRKRLSLRADAGGKINIGDCVFFNNDVSINARELVTIGSHVLIGENVKIYDHNHAFGKNYEGVQPNTFKTAPITIGDGVWIGSNVTILKGVTIGSRAIIAAGTVVNQDVQPDVIYQEKRSFEQIPIHYRKD
ncbi:Acetyltransferase [Fructobacillus tropaeoli]|nr:Acetyltransferase [Fructobacillus tropaeoli]